MKFDEKDIYDGDVDEFERPKPRRSNPFLLVLCALLIAAAWTAWQMHLRAVARKAGPGGIPGITGVTSVAPPAPEPDPEALPAAAPAAPAAGVRRFYGVVYDLETKKPLSWANVVLMAGPPGGAMDMGPCPADLNGHYTCDIAESVDYVSVYVSSEGYKGQFEDFYPTLRKRTAEERRSVLAQRDGYLEPARLTFTAGQSVIQADLVAVPQAWTAPAPRRP